METMFALVEQGQESGQTQQAFAKAHNLSRPCFSYWRAKYRASKSNSNAPRFFTKVIHFLISSKNKILKNHKPFFKNNSARIFWEIIPCKKLKGEG